MKAIVVAVPVLGCFDKPKWFSDVRQTKLLRFPNVQHSGSQRAISARSYSIAAEWAILGAMSIAFPGFQPPARYAYTPSGKPFFPDRPQGLSITHGGAHAVCAIADGDVGIDIEGAPRGGEALVRRCLDEREYALYRQSREPSLLFRRYWTAKESFVKMTGEGLTRPLREVAVYENRAINGTRSAWLWEADLDGDRIALCTAHPMSVDFYWWKPLRER